MNDNELMKSMPIPQTVAKMAIPSIISSLVTVVYNMADTFFVGQTGDPLQVAAVSLTNPIFILFMAFANMFGMGGSAAASILRQGVLLIPVLYLLNGLFGLNGVIYGQALTDCVTVLLSIIFWRKLCKGQTTCLSLK